MSTCALHRFNQGNQTLKLPASLVLVLIVALNLAAEGEI